jgi:putative FmdB family regulatory protein
MPTYEYECEKCGRFQVAQRITEDPLKVCPHCGQAVRKLIAHNIGVVYKCGGFYCTDNKGGGSSKGSSAAGNG